MTDKNDKNKKTIVALYSQQFDMMSPEITHIEIIGFSESKEKAKDIVFEELEMSGNGQIKLSFALPVPIQVLSLKLMQQEQRDGK
jgi:hypothetical protein